MSPDPVGSQPGGQGFDLVIEGGNLVTAGDTFRADLGILGQKIAAIGFGLHGRKVIKADGSLVLPGAVDPHVHLNMPAGETRSSDDWRTGTQAACCGGTTTILDFVEPQEGESLMAALESRLAEARGQAVIDFGLHMTLSRADVSSLAQVAALVEAGVTSFKVYTTYDGLRLDDAGLLAALAAVGRVGGLTMAHCENDALLNARRQSLWVEGQLGPSQHPRSRPAEAEGEAVQRVLALAESTHARVYIVHVSTCVGAQAIARSRRRGQEAFGETCPQYLLLTDTEYERPGFEGAKYVCSPPLRTAADQSALWQALTEGTLQTVATDHCPFNFVGQKDLGLDDFTLIPSGLPGIEARLGLMYNFGVREGRFGLERWVELCSTAPARLFGLYPRKGSLMPGADADLVVFDPDRTVTLSPASLHENVDYTPYQGLRLQGYPVLTLSRGTIVMRDGEFVGPDGWGEFLRCERPALSEKGRYDTWTL